MNIILSSNNSKVAILWIQFPQLFKNMHEGSADSEEKMAS